jgi:nucleotide-binding universal stress UspA family protein
MYEKILVAIDESETAERVLTAAEELARLSCGEIWLLHVWEGEPSVYKSVSARSYEDARSRLETAAEKIAASGIRAHPVVVANLYGYAAREITNIAVALEVDVIVMGSRGRNGVTELLGGSTSHKVIHLADRPVVVVR